MSVFQDRGFINESLTLTGVVAPASHLLVVYVVLSCDGSAVGDVAVDWGPYGMTISPFVDGFFDTGRTILTKVATLPVTSANAGTRTVTVTANEPGVYAVSIYAWTILGGISYNASSDDSHYTPAPGPIDGALGIPDNSNIIVFATFQLNETVDGGSYSSGATPIRSDQITGGVDVGKLSIATFDAPTSGTYHPTRALVTSPNAYWGHGMSFHFGSVPPPPPVSLGGYTSYDVGRFDEGSPQGKVTPEVAARIAAGDQRYMRGN